MPSWAWGHDGRALWGVIHPPRNPSTQRDVDPYRPGALSTPKTLNGHKSGPFGRMTTIFGATKMYLSIAEADAGATEA